MNRVFMLICATALCWNAYSAQGQAVSQETLLDAYYDLWHDLGRQPTAEEVESQTPYSAGRFLEEWENWDGVRQALVDHLYQRALFAALQQDTETATEFYQKILEVDPDHPEANAAYGVDLDEAAGKRGEFTLQKAGSPAMSSFLTFITLRNQGDVQGAREYYMLAQSQKAGYVAAETAKLKDLYDSAVSLYDRGSYAEAIDRFQLLMEINPAQAGYEEFYRPNAGAIQQYLEDAEQKRDAAYIAKVSSRAADSEISVWITGNWMAQFGEMGLRATYLRHTESGLRRIPKPGIQKLGPKSFIGGDLGAAYRVTDLLRVGVSWTQIVLTPYAEVTAGNLTAQHKMEAGSFSALSVFVEPSTMVSNTMRVYAQAGVGRYSADFPETSLGGGGLQPRLSSHTSASLGGFLGGGCDVWVLATSDVLMGVRMDMKYHMTKGEDSSTGRTITLSGVRMGVGLTFSL
ncbi:MAG: hypothetical protein OXI19_00110 [Gemmatimonadota bacterium]|nr:hypothetical protein [Gemmatimonadota bacterium]